MLDLTYRCMPRLVFCTSTCILIWYLSVFGIVSICTIPVGPLVFQNIHALLMQRTELHECSTKACIYQKIPMYLVSTVQTLWSVLRESTYCIRTCIDRAVRLEIRNSGHKSWYSAVLYALGIVNTIVFWYLGVLYWYLPIQTYHLRIPQNTLVCHWY